MVRYPHIFKNLPGKTLACFRDNLSAPFSNLFIRNLPSPFRLVGNLVDHAIMFLSLIVIGSPDQSEMALGYRRRETVFTGCDPLYQKSDMVLAGRPEPGS